ncbi:MAG: twin-arginine translocase subunit TatC [Rhodospirillaceae bacterium]|nr:twin-arginine translocase subunit TatC [Rhodospirillaceae bacterium]
MITDIDDTKLPLLEHLIELRKRLVRSAAVVLIAFLPCFYFAPAIFNFLALPLYDAYGLAPVEEDEEPGEEGWFERTLNDISLLFTEDGPSDEETPDGNVVTEGTTIDRSVESEFPPRFIFTSPQEAFLTYVKVGFFVSLCVSLPFLAYQLWAFVGPGLYRKEKTVVLPFMLVFPLLFALGAAMVYYAFFPVALQFFLGFQQGEALGKLPIVMEVRVSEYFSLLLKLLFAFGISFQLPLVMTLLARTGMVTAQGLKEKRKYAIVAVFVLAAVITPPDPFSQLGLALPMILLYEISIWCARITERKKAQAAGEAGDAETEQPDIEPEDTDDLSDFEETDFNPTR